MTMTTTTLGESDGGGGLVASCGYVYGFSIQVVLWGLGVAMAIPY
jgi:hypothetical protein